MRQAPITASKRAALAILPEGEAPKPEPGLPSLVAGVGKSLSAAGRPQVMPRPDALSAETATAIDNAIDWNPDASYAAWTYRLMGLKDWELVVLGDDGEPDEALTAEAVAWTETVFRHYGGGVDALLAVGLDSVLRRGAVAIELDVADNLRDVLDVDLIDPGHVDFQTIENGPHKQVIPVYVPSTGGDPIPFNEAQFHYEALASLGRPHGASPFLPLVDTAFSYATFRDSMQRVAKNQGWSRLALIYDYQALVRSAPPGIIRVGGDGAITIQDWDGLKAHIEAFKGDLEDDLESMFEDDNWILPNLIKPDSIGANHATESLPFDKLAQLFDQDAILGAKSQPAIHGRQWGSDLSSTGSVQWMVHALGVEALRELPARTVVFAVNAWLRITGRRGMAVLEFESIRKEDRKTEAEAAQIETQTVADQLALGVIDLAEAAMLLTGHEPPESIDSEARPLNAAQVTSALTIVAGVADGTIPRETGVQMLAIFFGLPSDLVDAMLGDLGTEEPEEEPAPAPPPPAEDEPEGEGEAPPDEEAWLPHAASPRANGHRAEPFEPAEHDALGPVEMDQEPPPDDDDARRVAREFNEWARENAPTFDGMLDAVVVSSEGQQNGRARATRADDPVAGAWQWDEHLARWRYPAKEPGRLGRLLPPGRADSLMERRLDARRKEALAATDRLLDGRATPAQWQRALRDIAKATHLEARMIAAGGRHNMSFTDYGAVGGRLSAENRIIGSIGEQVQAGELSPAQIRQVVAGRYEANVRETYRRGREAVHTRAGYAEERNLLEPGAEHCAGCMAETDRGWVAIGAIRPIGARDCSRNCKCRLEFRVSEDASTPADRSMTHA